MKVSKSHITILTPNVNGLNAPIKRHRLANWIKIQNPSVCCTRKPISHARIKMWHIYTMEYYAAIINDKFVSFVGTWMNLENIILSKLTQEQKMKHRIFSLIGG